MSEFVAPTWYVDTSTEILAELASLGQVLYTALGLWGLFGEQEGCMCDTCAFG